MKTFKNYLEERELGSREYVLRKNSGDHIRNFDVDRALDDTGSRKEVKPPVASPIPPATNTDASRTADMPTASTIVNKNDVRPFSPNPSNVRKPNPLKMREWVELDGFEVPTDVRSFDSFIKEESSDKSEHAHVIAFGRMNPPTAGHGEVVNTLKDKAEELGAPHTLVLSGTHGTKDGKNPLTPEQKLKHAQRAFPTTNIKVADKSAPTIMHQAAELHKNGVKNLHFVGGSDRQPMVDLLKKYNGHEGKHGMYNFDSITFHNAGDRDEDADTSSTAGISGTKLRAHVDNGEKDKFHAALSKHMSPEHKEELWDDLRKARGHDDSANS